MIDKIQNRILLNNNNNISASNHYKYIRIVAMVYMTLLLAATVVAYRIVEIGFVPEPGSTLIYTFSFFLANVYTEVYGARLAKKLIWESIFCGYLFAMLLMGVNYLPAPDYWDNTGAYNQVLGHVFRFTNAGVTGYLISSLLNVHIFEKWKHKMNGQFFWFRSLLATSISEGVATFIAGLITFFGMMPTMKVMTVMLSALIFKLIYGFIAVWPANFLAFVLKKEEKINHIK